MHELQKSKQGNRELYFMETNIIVYRWLFQIQLNFNFSKKSKEDKYKDLEMIRIMMCYNIMLIHENYGVNKKLGSYNNGKLDLFDGGSQLKFLAHEGVFEWFKN